MTRKDYTILAEAFKLAVQDAQADPFDRATDWVVGVALAVDRVSDALQADNPRFDRGLFLAAVRGEA